jgi:hypothetical protein
MKKSPMRRAVSPNKSKDSKENIHVYLRVRPISKVELEGGDVPIWTVSGNSAEVNKEVYKDLVQSNSN